MTKHLRIPLLVTCVTLVAVTHSHSMDIPVEYKIGGFATGTQSYSFRQFSALEAIERTAEAGGRTIEFYPGQRFSPQEPELKWDHDASDEMIAQVEEYLARLDVLAVNYGVVEIPQDEDEARKVFDFARRLKLRGITTSSVDSIDTIEALAKEYEIKVAFHNHPRRDDWPAYRLWDPQYLRELLDGRDSRVGACADTGHWIRSGLDPIESLTLLDGRIVSVHLKDRQEPDGHDVILGTGRGKVGEVLEELKRQGFTGHISVEYEHNWEESVPDIAQSIGFIRGYGTARGWVE